MLTTAKLLWFGESYDILNKMGVSEQSLKRILSDLLSLETGINGLRETLYLSRMVIPLNKVALRPSSIHGYGVFATVEISVGEVVTLYPGDFVKKQYTRDEIAELSQNGEINATDLSKDGLYGIMVGKHVPREFSQRVALDPECYGDHEFTFDEKYSLIGCPEMVDDPAYLGHMCNDSVMPTPQMDIFSYWISSTLAANAEFVNIADCHLALCATKFIRPGEEILVTYGYNFWT